VRAFALAASLLPPDLGDYRDDLVDAFTALWSETTDAPDRIALGVRCFGRLAWVWVLEWLEFIGALKAPGRSTTRGGGMGFLRDFRYALRTLAKTPTFTATTVALVAVGVGAVTTIFTLVDHVLLRPLPYPEADRLVFIENGSHSGPFFQALAASSTVEEWAGAHPREVNVVRGGHPRLMTVGEVTRDFFDLLGARAVRGRLLSDEDFAAADVVVLDGRAWRTEWAGDEEIVGKTIRVDGSPAVVVGVVDPAFDPPEVLVGGRADLWRPVRWSSTEMSSHDYWVLNIAGRRNRGSSLAAVQDEIDRTIGALGAGSDRYRTRNGDLIRLPVARLADATVADVRTGLGLLLGAVVLLLLVACANVAHLFLARALGRTREMAVRRAVGAGTGTLVLQLLAESLVVALLGGLVGAGLAHVGLGTFLALNPSELPREAAVTIDVRVLAFALAVSVLTAMAFGLVPALRSVRGGLASELRTGGRGSTGGRGVTFLRHGLVAGEVALSLVLVTAAVLLVRSFVSVRTQDPGFRVEDVWTLPLAPKGPEAPEEYVALADEITRALSTVPGVRSATYGLTMPMEWTGGGRCCWRSTLSVDGQDLSDMSVMFHPVGHGYFSTLGIPLVAGRVWERDDVRSEPLPLVLSEPLAIELFGSAPAALGRNLEARSVPAIVVGVAADYHHYGLEHEHGPALYLPAARMPFVIPNATVAVWLEPGAAGDAVAQLRSAVWSVAPDVSVPVVRSMEEWIQGSTAARRFESALFAAFAAVTLLLAAGGLYGTLLFVAGERRREVGIRLALGASRARVEGRLIRSGMGLTVVGLLIGLVAVSLVGRSLETRIWGVESGDPATLVPAVVSLLITALLASWLPARRAGRTDPVEALRAE
jgi:putative ABC transport system permease protein